MVSVLAWAYLWTYLYVYMFFLCVFVVVFIYKCVRGQVSPHPLEISHYSFLLALWGPLSVPHCSLSNCLETWLEGTSSPDLSICMSLWPLKSLLKRGHMTTLCGELILDQFTHIFISGLLCFIWTYLFSPLMRKWVVNTPVFRRKDMLSSAECFWSAKSMHVDADSPK